MAKRKKPNNKLKPLRRPTHDELRLAGAHCRKTARKEGTTDALSWMELGTLLDTTDAHRAFDVIWHTFTVGYPAGGTGSTSKTEPSSSTERAALTDRNDAAAINLRLIVLLVEEQPFDHNQARTLVIGLRSAMHNPNRTGTACPDCGHIVDTHRKKCWRKDCPGNSADRECVRCKKQIADDEQIVAGMHRSCYNAKNYAKSKTTKDERGTSARDVHDTKGMLATRPEAGAA